MLYAADVDLGIGGGYIERAAAYPQTVVYALMRAMGLAKAIPHE